MNYKMTECSNEQSVGYSRLGVTAELSFRLPNYRLFWFADIYSSTIKSIEFDEDDNIIIQTRNTKYVFQEVREDEDEIKN